MEASDIRAIETMKAKLARTYELYGFDPVENPYVEFSSALGKFLPDQDRPNEGVFSFTDDDKNWLSLRYDLTAPLARYVAQNFERLPKPFRSYRCGWVFRNEKPGPGRFRQFMQFDADTVGASGVSADAEMCMMAADAMECLGIAREEFVVKVSNRKLLDGIMDTIGLADPTDAPRRLIVLRAIDKTDRLGLDGVRALLGQGREDESGDFTRGAGLDKAGIERVVAMLSAGRLDNAATIAALRGVVSNSPIGNEGLNELRDIAELVEAAGYSDRVRLDPSVVRVSNITPVLSMRLNSPFRPPVRPAKRRASARWEEAAVMMAWSAASKTSRSRRRAFRSAYLACWRRLGIASSCRSSTLARSWCLPWIKIAPPTISGWSRNCVRRVSGPRCTWPTPASRLRCATPTSAILPVWSYKAATNTSAVPWS